MRGLELSQETGYALAMVHYPQEDNEQIMRWGIWFFWIVVAGTLILAVLR